MQKIHREEPCRICQSREGTLLALIDYWNLQTSNLVKCDSCRLSQLDPMLSIENQEVGCEAYFYKEQIEISPKEQKRNMIRNFRRGVVFGYSLKLKNICPQNILEFGPGSGYFLEGIKFVFPTAKITVVDVVQAVLDFNKHEHGYNTIKSLADDFKVETEGVYDLIIARDILEHVSDVGRMIVNVKKLLCVGGFFHFLTPNGHEDYWGHKMCQDLLKKRSELLINHVNYFDGQGLKLFLQTSGFLPIEYYTYQFKNFVKGKGWKNILTWSTQSTKKDAASMISFGRAKENPRTQPKNEILRKEWYISGKFPLMTFLYSYLKHNFWIKINPKFRYGHEIFGLFKRVD